MKAARVTRNGQVTIPKELRQALDIDQGDVVEFDLIDEGLVLRPKKVRIIDPGEKEVYDAPLTTEEKAGAEIGWAEYLAGKSKSVDEVMREELHERTD